MKIALVIFITLALAGCALLSLHMGVIPVPWRALLTDWQAGREHYYVLMEYRLPRNRYAKGEQQWAFHREVVERVSHLPGVSSAAVRIRIISGSR